MAISSTLTPQDVTRNGLRVSSATIQDVAFYDRAAYRRMDQITTKEQDGLLITTLFPKASIELLTLLELSWWPNFAAKHGMAAYKNNAEGRAVTAFDPAKLLKMNQSLIQLEVYKAVEIFYSTIVTDNANVNEKDAANHSYAMKRFNDEWIKAKQESAFYDVDSDGEVTADEESVDGDASYFDGDRRYF